jgi:hypothetical protein
VFKKNTWSAWFEGYSLLKETVDNGDGSSSDLFEFVVSSFGDQVSICSQTIAQRGVWYHVAATYDGNQSILYVNGAEEASATPGFPLDYDTTPLFIGTTGTWAPYLNMFGGLIDETSIYNRALSAGDIAAIYNAGSAGKCAIQYSPVTLQRRADGTVLLEAQGWPGESFDIQASQDLINWLDLGSFQADTNGVMQFNDTNAPAFPARFYHTSPQ